MGNYTEILETAIKGVGSLITTFLGAKFLGGVGKLLGAKGGSAGSLAGILTSKAGFGSVTAALSTGGAIALGVAGGVAAVKGIETLVGSIADKKRDEINSASEEAGEANKANSFGNATVQSAIESANRMENTGGIVNAMDNGFKKSGLFGLGAAFGWGDSYSAKEKAAWANKDYKQFNIYKPLSAGINDLSSRASKEDRAAIQIAYALALDEVGMLSQGIMKEIFGSSVNINSQSDLYELMASAYKNMGVGFKRVSGWAANLYNQKIKPVSYSGSEWDGNIGDVVGRTYLQINKTDSDAERKEAFEGFKSHRFGLPEVPYDDYPAMLHKGEAVLTASTAGELRNLVDEYRQTDQQAINYEAIIQNQTNELIIKMDQIIQVMQYGSVTEPTDKPEADKKIWNSMLKLRSTKSF